MLRAHWYSIVRVIIFHADPSSQTQRIAIIETWDIDAIFSIIETKIIPYWMNSRTNKISFLVLEFKL